MSRVWGYLLAVGLMLGCPMIAWGQQALRDRDPDAEGAKKVASDVQQANFHWGSFYLMSHLRLTNAGLRGDFNVPTGDKGGGATVGVEAPHRLYYVPHRKVVFSGEVIPSYTFFRGADSNGQFDLSARADLHLLFNHLYLNVYAKGSDKLEAYVAEINRLATTKEQEFGVSGEFKYSSRTHSIFSLRKRDTEFPADRFQPVGSDLQPLLAPLARGENNARLSVHHKTLPLTSLFVAVEASKYDFDQSARNSSRRSASGGAIFDSGKTRIRLEGGSTSLEFDDPAALDFLGPTGSVTIERTRGRWSAGINLARDVAFAVYTGNDYYETTILSAGVSRMLGRTIQGRVNAFRERDEFPVAVNGIKRRDDISFYSTGFTYAFWKASVGTDVGWYERKSTGLVEADSGIRWLLHLSLTL